MKIFNKGKLEFDSDKPYTEDYRLSKLTPEVFSCLSTEGISAWRPPKAQTDAIEKQVQHASRDCGIPNCGAHGAHMHSISGVSDLSPAQEMDCGHTAIFCGCAPILTGGKVTGFVPALAEVFGDTEMVTSATGGKKGKKDCRLSEIDPWALEQLGKVAGHGSDKYGERLNFLKGLDWSLMYDAMNRHMLLAWQGEDVDPEDGTYHFAKVAWHALALLAHFHHQIGTDDRFVNG